MSLVLPKPSTVTVPSKYAPLGLRDLPFPTNAVVNPYSSDERTNGSIYAESIAKEAINKFERLLIRPDDFFNRARLAYLWSKGDRETGRGTGKTALLRYFRQRINKDWGQTEFSGQSSASGRVCRFSAASRSPIHGTIGPLCAGGYLSKRCT